MGGLVASTRLSYGSSVGRSGGSALLPPPKFTVAEVISAILNTFRVSASDPSHQGLLSVDPSLYDLRIAEDDGGVDTDFPPCDSAVPITHIGMDRFVLCETANDRPILRVSIPCSAVTYRPIDGDALMAVPELSISCYWVAQPHISTSLKPFTARLTGSAVNVA